MTKFQQAATYTSLIGPAQAAAATAALTANLDTAGADYATILVHVGIEKNTDAAPPTNFVSISESDDTVVTNFATWDATFISNPDNTAAAVSINNIDLKGRKRYLRLTVTPDTTTNGNVQISAIGILTPDVKSASAATNQNVG
jgi:hypothetical protein